MRNLDEMTIEKTRPILESDMIYFYLQPSKLKPLDRTIFRKYIFQGKAKMLKENFYSIFPEYFERNSRWSYKMSEVPKLGDADATREEVEAFYEYWYEFKSWRDYHWEDEEDIESAQDRYEKREIEKFNRSAR